MRYRTPSLWSAHKGTVLSAIGVLAVQSLLIVALLYQRRARQRAESDSRRNLALAADSSRRETMSALTSAIGDELSQPLSSIMYNVQACVIDGDQVLLQQVFVNLLMNAVDAMADMPPGRRHLTISSDVRGIDLDVSVRDTGPGLPADILGTLFTLKSRRCRIAE